MSVQERKAGLNPGVLWFVHSHTETGDNGSLTVGPSSCRLDHLGVLDFNKTNRAHCEASLQTHL